MSDGFRRVPKFLASSKLSSRLSKKPLDDDEALEKKVDRLFNGQDLLFERLESEPKLSTAMKKSLSAVSTNVKRSARTTAVYVGKQSALAKVLVIVGVSLVAGGLSYLSGDEPSTNPGVNQVAGTSTVSTTEGATGNTTMSSNNVSFDVITPAGKEVTSGVERETPAGDKIYSYSDDIGGTRIIVTQQQLPEIFSKDQAIQLAEFAKTNYMNNIIQIDEDKIYHGLNEKSGIQSFVLIKAERLIFIQSDQKLLDDNVASYVLALE